MKAKLIANLAQQYKQLRVDMRTACITSTPFVIECGEFYVSPEIVERRTTGKFRIVANPLRATRFSRVDAQSLAAGIKNGAGEKGKAVGIYHAVRKQHDRVRSLLHTLRTA